MAEAARLRLVEAEEDSIRLVVAAYLPSAAAAGAEVVAVVDWQRIFPMTLDETGQKS